MKELLATGVMVTALTLSGVSTHDNENVTIPSENISTEVSEGFVPHDRVTSPPVQGIVPADGLLPDFGSQAYL